MKVRLRSLDEGAHALRNGYSIWGLSQLRYIQHDRIIYQEQEDLYPNSIYIISAQAQQLNLV